MYSERKIIGLLLAVFATVISLANSAPTQTQTEEDLVEILQLIRELGDSAKRLEDTLNEQTNEVKEEANVETELAQVNEKEQEPEAIAEESEKETANEERHRWNKPRPQITKGTEADFDETSDLETRGGRRGCNSPWCQENNPSADNETDSDRIDQLMQALTMLKKMKSQQQKRDYDIPFP